jgi:hypothetical protein
MGGDAATAVDDLGHAGGGHAEFEGQLTLMPSAFR